MSQSSKSDLATFVKENRGQSSVSLKSRSSAQKTKQLTIDDPPYESPQTRRLRNHNSQASENDSQSSQRSAELKRGDNFTANEKPNTARIPVHVLKRSSRRPREPGYILMKSKSLLDPPSVSLQETIEYELFQDFLHYLKQPQPESDKEETAQSKENDSSTANTSEQTENLVTEAKQAAPSEQELLEVSSKISDNKKEEERENENQRLEAEEEETSSEASGNAKQNEELDVEMRSSNNRKSSIHLFPRYQDEETDNSDIDQDGEKDEDPKRSAQVEATSENTGIIEKDGGKEVQDGAVVCEVKKSKSLTDEILEADASDRTKDDHKDTKNVHNGVLKSLDEDEECDSELESDSGIGITQECKNQNEGHTTPVIKTKEVTKVDERKSKVKQKLHYSLIDTPYMTMPLKNIYSQKSCDSLLILKMADNVDINENRENEQPNSAKKKRYTPSKWKRYEIKTAKTADFNALPDHNGQNIYLRGCISVTPDAQIRRRPRKDDAKKRTSYTYSFTLPTRTEDVYKSAFCGTLGIKESRDICDKCEKFTANIKAAEAGGDPGKARELTAQHELHIRKADVFNV
ncbi:protein starmaker-like [Watersipora subatra]|uniref:protein starmaker-like n=1 Tax=Watersipora subatra TaxID=2589382 RepID=UPI00355C2905